jgi:trigger factor
VKTTRTDESPSRIRLSIEAEADELKPAVDRAFAQLAQEVKVPGFRKGKVPRPVLQTRLGKDAIREATLREAIPLLLSQAVRDEELAPIVPPTVEVKDFEESHIAFEAVVEVRPEIKMPELSTLVATRASATPSDDEVTEQLNRLRERFASLETVSRPARRGDYVLIDLRSYVHDVQIDQATATDLLYELGSGSFVPELDQNLDGTRTGDILKFNATLPEGFGEHAGKEVSFQVLVKEVKQKNLPSLDDEFAKTASEFDSLDQLRGDIATKVSEIKRIQNDIEVRNHLMEQLIDNADVEPPESLVREEMAYRAARFADQLRSAGVTLERYLSESETTEEGLESDLRRQADRNVAARLVLEEIAKRESLTVTAEEVEEELRYHAEQSQVEPDELRKDLERSGRLAVLAGDIIRRKALNVLVERAEIRDEDAPGDSGESELVEARAPEGAKGET